MFSKFYLAFITYLAVAACDASTTSLDSSEAAAVADFPLVAAFMQDFTKYSYADYQSYVSAQSSTIPYNLNNYFLAFEQLSNYDQVESAMMKTFPFSEFGGVVTAVPWYTELLDLASMSTYYYPTDFPTGTVVTYGSAESNSASASPTASAFSISATSVTSSSASKSSSSQTKQTSSISASYSSSSSSVSKTSSTTKPSNLANASIIYLPFLIISLVLAI
ncbi:uncharacterized protein HGUI_03934 [Hanseniaspora guilliermondii]|uniref:Uncharacterized protein n=1 Tax=Hanseniaspora guilliermondii TaxID=56406 RepID=A0A1L0CRQ0_9ASCO|nr:uncharacterized protein HGUI_03934 [Hanseniaspora guilliermondii]